jgi:hypothetical protein
MAHCGHAGSLDQESRVDWKSSAFGYEKEASDDQVLVGLCRRKKKACPNEAGQ